MVQQPPSRRFRSTRRRLAATAAAATVVATLVTAGPWSGGVSAGGATAGQAVPSVRTEDSIPPQPDQDRDAIRRLYLAYFLREPDVSGLEYWVLAHLRGRPLAVISEQFARSSEFVERYGQLSDPDFVELIYANLFDRSGDAGGLAYWTKRLAQGATRGAVMLHFSESPEFRRITAIG